MKSQITTFLLSITIIGLSIIPYGCSTSNKSVKDTKALPPSTLKPKDISTADWKSYSNPQLPFTFQYPETWVINGREYYPVNGEGEIMSVMFTLIDTVTSSSFFLNYHLAPYGKQLFETELSDYNTDENMYSKGKNKIFIAGNEAIVAINSFYVERSSEKDIEQIPVHFSSISFLDKKGTGEVELKIKIPVSIYEQESLVYNEVLASFKFAE